jgi:hypothetical protein
MTYQEFCNLSIRPLTQEERQSADETVATSQEIQWRKGYEVLRAIRHKRAGIPTKADLKLVAEKTSIFVSRSEYRRAQKGE